LIKAARTTRLVLMACTPRNSSKNPKMDQNLQKFKTL
jgi:hypothetical protein